MSVKINIPSYFQYFTANNDVVEVSGDSVIGCLKQLVKKYPEIEKLLFDSKGNVLNQSLHHVAVFVNGTAVYSEGLTSKLNDGDEIDLTYVILGG